MRDKRVKSKNNYQAKLPKSSGSTDSVDKRTRDKRSGVEAVKLYLETSGSTGRSSRSATAVFDFLNFYY